MKTLSILTITIALLLSACVLHTSADSAKSATFYCQDTDLWYAVTSEAEEIGCELDLVADPVDADLVVSVGDDWRERLLEVCQ